ncbi:hydroxycinnamoyl-CoA shikimate/quinatehydroxycinnamoyl transferase [Striga asiatica]|uniref:Hydroxycinnamoyl-CoA shikimate/quinatehydroxycinnamoyl transferase n=1 Tax=Striga asiatica TaxID=4170 RepID=A0A5A7P8S5_STRAF|nr:hydroxycinnamoyl-CoA shikimate/quinatehydroxycinnamoyl transferase [Striga asiatica]
MKRLSMQAICAVQGSSSYGHGDDEERTLIKALVMAGDEWERNVGIANAVAEAIFTFHAAVLYFAAFHWASEILRQASPGRLASFRCCSFPLLDAQLIEVRPNPSRLLRCCDEGMVLPSCSGAAVRFAIIDHRGAAAGFGRGAAQREGVGCSSGGLRLLVGVARADTSARLPLLVF